MKRARGDESATYADLAAAAQVYTGATFTEIETLGPLVDLEPGGSVEHRERWEVHLVSEGEAEALVDSGALDEVAGPPS